MARNTLTFVISLFVGLNLAAISRASETAHATFAGGCYWCMQEAFEKVPGVVSVTTGWAGGTESNPKIEEIESGKTGYAEAIDVEYNTSKITYEQLLDSYWHNIDPLTAGGQFCDRGKQYRSAIFFSDDSQRRLAEESKGRVAEQLHGTVVTEIAPATRFLKAPASQQDYYKKNASQYRTYVEGCGRHRRLEQLWGNAAAPGRSNP